MTLDNEARRQDRRRWWAIHDPETYVCPDCERTRDEHGSVWEVHHLDAEPGRIVGLCLPCHRKRHRRANVERRLGVWRQSAEVFVK